MRPLSRLLVPLCALAALLLAATPASARVAGKFAFVRAGHVYVKQTATPTVRPLQVSIQPTARHVAITMDGAKVVWSTTSEAVAVTVRSSTADAPAHVFTVPGRASVVTPAWFGASGLRIGFIASAFTVGGSAPRDRLGWMNGDGTGAQLTFSAPAGTIDARKLSWGANGVLFSWKPAGAQYRNLFAYRPGNDTLVQITHAFASGHSSYSQAVWSRGGAKIAAVVDGRLVIMNADGTDQRLGPFGRSPSFSPDGQTLAFIRPSDGHVRAVSVTFTNNRALTTGPVSDLSW